MEMNSDMTRREMGCGYLPPLERRLPLWQPPGWPDDPPSACAGYLVRLPQVVEVARGFAHWSKGELAAFAGANPNELFVIGLEILNGSVSDLNVAVMTPASKGGLGSG